MHASLVHCTLERHGQAILAILNHAITTSTALYDYQPRPYAAMHTWFANKAVGNYPVLGLENEAGDLLGFASYGTWRAFPAYKYSVEHSVYVHHAHRGQGFAKTLMQQLIAHAQTQNLHMLIGAIDASNAASIALHAQLGFEPAGTVRQAGFKFGRWLDVAFYQMLLPTPFEPVDG
jgi:L-amino acid N-acyltransferase